MHRILGAVIALLIVGPLAAEPLTDDQKSKVEAKLASLKSWGTQQELIDGIRSAAPGWAAGMTQDKWAELSVLSPEVKELAKTPPAVWLRGARDPAVSEVFVSRADGTKVAYLAKPTNWSHKGKPKHEVPMTGKTWVGTVETDESTGLKQVQVSFPVLDKGAVIGSVVVGLQLSKL